ncbi:MAG: hypothetical protein P8L34_04055 [Arenicellales bacterium]|nr:hypothetical protein [Arenicellales bacterium]
MEHVNMGCRRGPGRKKFLRLPNVSTHPDPIGGIHTRILIDQEFAIHSLFVVIVRKVCGSRRERDR